MDNQERTNEYLKKFKCILEYFVAHLHFVQTNDESGIGYADYIKPLQDNNVFLYSGQGYKGQQIQKQVKNWDVYGNYQLCINITPSFGNYTTRGCYLNWKDTEKNVSTGINIIAEWKDTDVDSLGIYEYWEKGSWDDLGKSYTIKELGLFDGNDNPTDSLVDFFNFYYEIIVTYCENMKYMDYIKLLDVNHNIILTGAPGTGKTYLAKQIAAQMILGKEYDKKNASDDEKKKMKEQCDFVQFHPSYDYTDFVEGLRPINDNNGNVGFERRDGIFMAFCRKALEAYKKAEDKKNAPKYIFIIDEINRGEISKIFGELFFSIDPGYRGTDGVVTTQYSNLWKETDYYDGGKKFYVPENVYIIGTMNDIDRSVESMDFAFRRRFAFKEVTAKESQQMFKSDSTLSEKVDEIIGRMDALNEAISPKDNNNSDKKGIEGLSSAYHIGASYFLKLANYKKDDGTFEYDKLWDYHLKGLLSEYLRGMPDAEDKLKSLGEAFGIKTLDSNPS